MYKYCVTLFFLLFAASLFAQSENNKHLEELANARDNKGVSNFFPSEQGGDTVVVVQDGTSAERIENADSVMAMLGRSGYSAVRVLNTGFTAVPSSSWLVYSCVIWVGTTSTGSELDSCTSYLNNGGRFIAVDNDEAYFFGCRPSSTCSELFTTYLEAAYVSDAGSDTTIVGMDLMAGLVLDVRADPWPDDVMLTGGNAVGLFKAQDTTFAATRASGLSPANNNYRAGLILWDPRFPEAPQQEVYDRMVQYVGFGIVPVELTAFTAAHADGNVVLNWATATETNNSGFHVERRTPGNTFESVAFVPGFGTTTEAKAYSYVDEKLAAGTYIYRLKQVDFDGTSEYTQEINVDVTAPLEFALGQNYPNPFNPATLIKFSLAAPGMVNLSVYNALGEKVSTLVNNVREAGNYEVKFDASNLTSGIYFYRLEAGNFVSIKKMMLIK